MAPKCAMPTKRLVVMKADIGHALSDNELIESIAGGDRNAFAILMKRYLPKMIVLAQRIVFDREQAREIAQEAFLKVWQQASKWDPYGTATFLTWLRLVVVNLSISARRRHHDQVGLEYVEEMPSTYFDGFDSIAMSDQKRVVKDALLKLPERQRAAVAVYYFDELPQIEAAEIMQMTPRAFDSLIVRARTNLKKYLLTLGLNHEESLT